MLLFNEIKKIVVYWGGKSGYLKFCFVYFKFEMFFRRLRSDCIDFSVGEFGVRERFGLEIFIWGSLAYLWI